VQCPRCNLDQSSTSICEMCGYDLYRTGHVKPPLPYKAIISAVLLVFGIWYFKHWQQKQSIHLQQNIERYASTHGTRVVIYTTSWCKWCTDAKKYLENNKITFYEYDIEKSAKGREQYDALHGSGVPLLLIGKTVLRGFSPQEVMQALSAEPK